MGDILGGAGSIAGAGVGAANVGIQIDKSVREWKRYQLELSQGSTEVEFTTESNLTPTDEEIEKQVRKDFSLDADKFSVTVTTKSTTAESTVLGFRSLVTKNKMGVVVSWNCVSKEVTVEALTDVTDKGGKTYPAGETWSGVYAQFVDDVQITTIGAGIHVTKAGHNFDIDAKLVVKLERVEGLPVAKGDLTIKLTSSLANRKGGGNGSTFKYVIRGNREIESTFYQEHGKAAALKVPNMFDENNKFDSSKVTRESLKAMYVQARSANQAMLFAMDKDGIPIPVYAMKADARVPEAKAFLVIGDAQAKSMREYILSQNGLTGTVVYKKSGFGKTSWEFDGVKSLKPLLEKEVQLAFKAHWSKSTGKNIYFK